MRYAVSRSFDASDYTIQRRQVVIGIIVRQQPTQTDQRSLIVISYNLMRILPFVVDRSIVAAAVAVDDRRIN